MRCTSISPRDDWGEHQCDLEDGHELPHRCELGLRCFAYWPFEPRPCVQIGEKIVYFDEQPSS